MLIEVIQLKDLEAYFYSERIQKQADLPISSLRVASQINNPSAKPFDEILIVAFNNKDEMVAYFGCLPTILSGHQIKKICYSSCWWKHPEKGNLAAIKVFAKALQIWNKQLLFDDLPQHSKTILEKIGDFQFVQKTGKKFFLKFDFKTRIPEKIPLLAFLKIFFGGLDAILNYLLSIFRRQKKIDGLTIETIKQLDEECTKFIADHNKAHFFKRPFEEINWILKYQWLSTNHQKYKVENGKYHFSLLCSQFENQLYKIRHNKKLLAILWFTNRDGLYKLPYAFYNKKDITCVAHSIQKILLKQKADSFITYQDNIFQALEYFRHSIYKKSITKTIAFPATLMGYNNESVISDGDGDVVFT